MAGAPPLASRIGRVEAYWRGQLEDARTLQEGEHGRQVEVLTQQLQQAKEQIRIGVEQRDALEEELKRAFMRGVCALNMEAVSILRHGNPGARVRARALGCARAGGEASASTASARPHSAVPHGRARFAPQPALQVRAGAPARAATRSCASCRCAPLCAPQAGQRERALRFLSPDELPSSHSRARPRADARACTRAQAQTGEAMLELSKYGVSANGRGSA